MRFIHAADLHIDSPLRGLSRYEGAPVEQLRSATREAFKKLVDLAIYEKVQFVILAGDIYDGEWQDFHTGLFFRGEMIRLQQKAIRVFIVHGNHDAESVITRQLDLPSNVKVFSSRKAETVKINELSVAIHGRSFPNRAVDEDLVPSYPEPITACFNIGILHTSLSGNAAHDTYAPCHKETLIEKGYDYWALGHVHMREVVCDMPRIIFSGNLQGRHAKETGAKGCELVTVKLGMIKSEFVALDVVRWHQISICLDRIDTLQAVATAFREKLKPLLLEADDQLHAVRVQLNGSTDLHAIEANQPGTLDAAIRAAAQDVDDSKIWIEKVKLSLITRLDRTQLGQRDDAIGELVHLVDMMAQDEHGLTRLIEQEINAVLKLPHGMDNDGDMAFDNHETRLKLLHDAEATVLARLSNMGEQS
ncbi:MAG: DNA repair exonuclease [Mariprofundaceae bacterium]|nr:DNA repair exonuclease [Mariprofundaceae bacterium]